MIEFNVYSNAYRIDFGLQRQLEFGQPKCERQESDLFSCWKCGLKQTMVFCTGWRHNDAEFAAEAVFY